MDSAAPRNDSGASEGGASASPVLRVLVVDDDDVMRETIAELLESEGYRISRAESARRALESMRRSPADLVLTDMKMPHMSGLEMLRVIKSEFPSTYVVMITGYGTVDLAVEAMKLGAFDFIQKPFKSELVLTAIRGVQEERRFKETVAPARGGPRDVLRSQVAAGSSCLQFTWSAGSGEAIPGAVRVLLTESSGGEPGTISGRDLFKIRERITQAISGGAQVTVLVEDIHRLLDFHAWPDVRTCLERIMETLAEGRGILLVTADGSRMSADQLGDMRKLLGSQFVDEVVDSLSSPMRRAALLLAEKAPAHFSELMRAAGTDSSPKLAFHLRKLVAEGLLVHAGEKYVLTEKGRRVIEFLRSLERQGAGGLLGQGALYLKGAG